MSDRRRWWPRRRCRRYASLSERARARATELAVTLPLRRGPRVERRAVNMSHFINAAAAAAWK